MTASTSAKRYAQAAFEVALEKKQLDEWKIGIRKIAELMQNIEIANLLENPKLPFDLKAKLLKEKLGKVDQLILNLAYLLIAKDKLRNAEQIAGEYEQLVDEHHGIRHADVITAVPVDNKDKEKIIGQLESITGKKIAVTLQVDPSILGGIVARIDGSLIDGSIRNKLELLKKELAETRK